MANPPSCGQIKPTKKAPKIGWTPIIPVKKDDASTIRIVRPTMDWLGPFCTLPFLIKIQRNAGLTR